MKRDFTWVQSIAVLFNKHQLFIGALKTFKWDDSVDRLIKSFDGAPVTMAENEGAKWQAAGFSITRQSRTNNIVVEAEGNFKITAKTKTVKIAELPSMKCASGMDGRGVVCKR
ncbi:hypothetical protein ACFE04_007855 [Oxalis oulophora]